MGVHFIPYLKFWVVTCEFCNNAFQEPKWLQCGCHLRIINGHTGKRLMDNYTCGMVRHQNLIPSKRVKIRIIKLNVCAKHWLLKSICLKQQYDQLKTGKYNAN